MGGFERLTDVVGAGANGFASAPAGRVALWLIAFLLLWSGIGKLSRPGAAALAMVDFRVVSSVRLGLGRALGAVEVTLAVVLVGASFLGGIWVTVAAGASALLFAGFAVLIGRALRDGERFACACFGGDSGEISWRTMLRAVALCVLACVLAGTGGALGSAGDVESALLPAVIAGAALASGVLAVALPHLLRWNADPFDHDDRVRERRYAQ